MDFEALSELLAVVSFSLSLFGAVLCLMQRKDKWPFRALALVLLCVCLIELDSIGWPVEGTDVPNEIEVGFSIGWLIGILCVAPLFWHYVSALTSITPRLPRRLWLHAVLPASGVLLAVAVAVMPQEARFGLFLDGHPLPQGWPMAVGIAGEILVLLGVLQWGGYIAAIVRTLLRYRHRLKRYVASTANRELGWIWAVMSTFSAYWLVSAIDTFVIVTSDGEFIPDWVDAVFGLGLLVTILLWGLRQRPGLAPDVVVPEPSPAKYEKSALSGDAAERIERKLRKAMSEDRLHQDPNLSLWTLARHIGASPNYISQTLNDQIGESFFDFVNGYRISDAKALLRETDGTVLSIAYDVGFNSRSSFYTAFRKVTGDTPTGFRAKVSAPS